MQTIDLKRTTISLQPDRTRVLARPFRVVGDQRSVKICARVMALPESEVHALLEQVLAEFGDRHPKVREFLKRQFDEVRPYLLNGQRPSEERALLLGGYFTTSFHSKPRRCSIPPSCRTRTSRTSRPVPYASF